MKNQLKDQPKLYLRRLFPEMPIMIGATDGTETIYRSANVFAGYRDRRYVNWGLNIPGNATPKSLAAIYEMTLLGTFVEVFHSLGEPDQLCWQQCQIVAICRDHPEILRTDEISNYFPFMTSGECFVSEVCVGAKGLDVYARRLVRSGQRSAAYCPRVIVPLQQNGSFIL